VVTWTSGTTSYQVRESADQVVEGIREQLRDAGLVLVTTPTRRGVQLRIETVVSEDAWSLPVVELGVVELRFARVGDLTEVSVRARRRRRRLVQVMLGTLGLFTLVFDVLLSMGMASVRLIRGVEQAQAHHREHDPKLLHGVAGFLGPREVGRIDAAPFRRELPEAN
jgi:hypothetical protein